MAKDRFGRLVEGATSAVAGGGYRMRKRNLVLDRAWEQDVDARRRAMEREELVGDLTDPSSDGYRPPAAGERPTRRAQWDEHRACWVEWSAIYDDWVVVGSIEPSDPDARRAAAAREAEPPDPAGAQVAAPTAPATEAAPPAVPGPPEGDRSREVGTEEPAPDDGGLRDLGFPTLLGSELDPDAR